MLEAAKTRPKPLFPHPPLTIAGVYASLLKVASVSGKSRVAEQSSIIQGVCERKLCIR